MTLLDRVLAQAPPPFALIHRPETDPDAVDVLVGTVSTPATLAEIPVRARPGHAVLALIPFRQLAERGFDCADDGTPLIAMTVDESAVLPLSTVTARVGTGSVSLSGGDFDLDDAAYGRIVRRIVDEEIGRGEGSNFVIRRTFVADVTDYSVGAALSFFRRLLDREAGAYWTFIVHTGDRTLVGASPERHVSLRGGTAVMNPISGTYRYPPTGPTLGGVLGFLADGKETEELYMTVDEELKMMSRICSGDVRVVGPYLKEMARLAHTEYFIQGTSDRDPREILGMTMFAPTVTGSPLENACRVIRRYEPEGRGYYSGVVALIGAEPDGRPAMDSAILIRTADIDATGRLRISVGATLVRESDPAAEAAETRGKAAGLLAALDSAPARFGADPNVQAALADRNTGIARFWLSARNDRDQDHPLLVDKRVLVVDAEDTFTSMIEHQLRSIGLVVTVRRYDDPFSFSGHDLVVMGPGPGDPRDTAHPKIARLDAAIATLLDRRFPFLAVCLSHQVLCHRLGFDLVRLPTPNQGTQQEIDLFGDRERVGFYNTFAAHSQTDTRLCDQIGPVSVSRDPDTGVVHALTGPTFTSNQFHAESVLTQDGVRIMAGRLTAVLDTSLAVPGR